MIKLSTVNFCLGRFLPVSHLAMAASPPVLVSWHQLRCVSQELSQLEERDIEGVIGTESMLVLVGVSLASISLA